MTRRDETRRDETKRDEKSRDDSRNTTHTTNTKHNTHNTTMPRHHDTSTNQLPLVTRLQPPPPQPPQTLAVLFDNRVLLTTIVV